ncbi:MAG: DUF2304 domain-containing protein [Candidatus Woesearchaeota archaeon]
MEPISYIVTFVGIILLVYTFFQFKRYDMTIPEYMFWNMAWLGLIVISLFPELTSPLAKLLGIGRGVDIIIYLSIIVLFYMVFKLYYKIIKIEQDITKLVRELSKK